MVNLPTRSQIEAWSTDHLEQAASVWAKRADAIAENYDKAQSALNGLRWTGAAGDQARDRYFRDLVDMRRGEDLLRKVATTARNGANDIANAKQAALDAIRRAELQLFDVSDDLHVTDRLPKIPGPFEWLRDLEAHVVESDVHAKALQLAAGDERVGNAVMSFSNPLREFTFSGFGPVPDAPNSPGGPTITGPAGQLQFEQDKYDLQVGFADGKGPTFGGDPRTHDNHWNPVDGVPRDPDSERAEHRPPDGTRSIPTGTAIGPNGERFGFFSYPDGKAPPGTNPYSTPGEAWDFSDPDNPKPLGLVQYPGPDGRMSSIYQPSGAYDKTTGRMVVVGNTTNSNGKIERVLFESDPIKPGDPPDQWLHTLHSSGTIQGMPGARENQLVALDGGGFALVGSDNTDVNDPSRTAVSAITASSAEGLTTAVPTTLVQGAPSDHGIVSPYGPSVIGTTYDPVSGKEVIDLRVSTWDGINQIQPDPNNPHYPYDPKTYTTTFTVQH
jgi:hypothetical protein